MWKWKGAAMLITADMALGPAFLAYNSTLILILFLIIFVVEGVS